MIVSLLALFACVEDVSKDKVEAKVEEVPEAAAKTEAEPVAVEDAAPALPGEVWTVDRESSTVKALGAKITQTHPIVFHSYEGQVGVEDGKLAGIAFSVDMSSLEADVPKLTEHLKTPDFFDVSNHPKATFTSTEVTEGSDVEGMTHTVKGTFTIRGETKLVTFPAKVELSEDALTAATEFALNRQDFKITYPGRPDDLVQDKVVLTVELKAAKPGV